MKTWNFKKLHIKSKKLAYKLVLIIKAILQAIIEIKIYILQAVIIFLVILEIQLLP